MPSREKDRLLILSGGLFLILTDQTLKYLARTNQAAGLTWKNLIGWEFFANSGIAFNIPFPAIVLNILTPLIIFYLIVLLLKSDKNKFRFLALTLIISGALSNYLDRILFGVTIDYLRFFTSIINLADIIILIGVVILLSKSYNLKRVIRPDVKSG